MHSTEVPLDIELQVDAYLQLTMHKAFKSRIMSKDVPLVLLARFSKPLKLTAAVRERTFGAKISPVYNGYRHATVTVSGKPGLLRKQLLSLQKRLGATCFELGTPQGLPLDDRLTINLPGAGPDVVVGIIDDGCPFAHRNFRHSGGAPNDLAVRFIWDQGGQPLPPAQPVPFNYGRFFVTQDLDNIMVAATKGGVIDEALAYSKSALPSLRSVTSHGAHVMTIATGWRHPKTPRPRYFAGTPAPVQSPPPGRKDLAFVQLPTEALDDPSGMWLDHYALDGIQAIRSYARDVYEGSKAGTVIINLSYGPQTGPHDGTSILETAMKEIIEKAEAPGPDQYCLKIVLPTGNNHLQRTHAEFNLANGGGEIRWWVAAESRTPSYLEIWLPPDTDFSKLDAALISPAGEEISVSLCVVTTCDDETAGTIAVPTCQFANRLVILMTIMPTARDPSEVPPGNKLAACGCWRIRLKAQAGVAGMADAYLARSDPNLGRPQRGHSGYLDSDNYDPKRYMRASERLVEPQTGSAEVVARGSMSGIATGDKTYVAAGFCARTSEPYPVVYSSGGPARRGCREGPTYAYPSDQSKVIQGVLGWSNRSGVVTRLVGTSFTAPMLARDLWMTPPLHPPALPVPPVAGPATWMARRFGHGVRE